MTNQYTRWQDFQKSPTSARNAQLEELRGKVHQYVIEQLGPLLTDSRLAEHDMRRRVADTLQEALTEEGVVLGASEKAMLIQDVTDDVLGYGPIDRYLKHDDVTEVMVNGPDSVYVEEKGKLDQDRHALRRRDAPASHHRQDREPGRPAHRRVDADGRRPSPRRLPCERGRAPAGDRRTVPHDPEVRRRPVHGRRPHQLRTLNAQVGAVPRRVRARPPERHRQRWYRYR